MNGAENMLGCKPWIPAKDIIDWSIPGTSIFNRKKPLALATIRRIMTGVEKFWGELAPSFLAVLHGTNDVRSLDLPLSSVTTSGGHHALITPMLLGQQSGAAARPVEQPVPTVATAGAIGVIQPFFLPNEGYFRGNKARSVNEPLPTVTASRGCGGIIQPLIMEYYGNGGTEPVSNPLKTVTTKDRFALLMGHQIGQAARPADQPVHTILAQGRVNLIQPVGLDITFRMLKNHELKKAQGFQGDYILKGNTTEQTKQIGNAVNPPLAEALADVAMSA